MGNPTDEEIQVSRLIAQSLQSDGAPGASVNHSNNPFLFGLIGTFDTLKMASRIITGLDQYRDNVRLGRERLAAEEAARAAAKATSPSAGATT